MTKLTGKEIDTTSCSESIKKLVNDQMIISTAKKINEQTEVLCDSIDRIMSDMKNYIKNKSLFCIPSFDAISGIELIIKERERQIKELGYTSEHDDNHTENFLALEAIRYATPNKDISLEGRIVELSKAGALIAAEIDRLQRYKP